jgi:hypothetical protein
MVCPMRPASSSWKSGGVCQMRTRRCSAHIATTTSVSPLRTVWLRSKGASARSSAR